jgi:zinc transport system substrate-binding protein
MRRPCLLLALAVILSALVAPGCDEPATRRKGQPVRVAASIPPLADLVKRIGGDHVETRTLIGPGKNPHNYNPPMRDYVWLEDAQMLVIIGTTFESQLARKVQDAYGHVTIVQTQEGLDLDELSEPGHEPHGPEEHEQHFDDAHADHGHDHAGQGEHDEHDDHHDHHDHDHHGHDHGGFDPHIWLDPILVRDHIAPRIARALISEAPEFQDDFRANLQKLQQELTQLHQQLQAALAPLKGTTFYVYHPALGHLARRYRMKQEAIELDGKSPSPRRVDELIRQARAQSVKVIFVQEQFPSQSADTIADQIGGAVVSVDPLQADYIQMLQKLARTLSEQLASHGSDTSR